MKNTTLLENVDIPNKEKQLLESKIKQLSTAEDILPVFIIHDLKAMSVVYMTEVGLKYLDPTLEEIRDLGPAYFDVYFNPEDAKNYLHHWTEFSMKKENFGSWFTFFQQVKHAEGLQSVWYLSISTVLIYNDDNEPLYSLTIPLQLNEQLPIAPKLERLILENNFLREKASLFIQLTKKEIEILALMAKGKSIKEIAYENYLSDETVRTHRRNIKKKLDIRSEVELIQYAQAFNII